MNTGKIIDGLAAAIGVPIHPDEPPSTLAQAMQEAHRDVDNHYAILAHSFRSIANDFRDKADYLDNLAGAVLERSERVKSEIIAASDFEQDSRASALELQKLVQKMSGVINQREKV